MISKPGKKLEHNGVINVENDDGFKELKEDKEIAYKKSEKLINIDSIQSIQKKTTKKGYLPYLVSQRNPRMTNILYSMLCNY